MIEDPDEVIGSTLVVGALALATGAVWAALPSTESMLAGPLTVPGSMTAGLLLAASYPAWSLSRSADLRALALPVLLLLVGFSEVFALHHDVEASVGLDWQAFYLPVLLTAVFIGRRSLGETSSTALTRTVLRVTAVGWIGALLVEGWQWRLTEASEYHAQFGTFKDMLEIGSSATLFVTLSLLDAMTDRPRTTPLRGQSSR